jgi:hypothetical protein
LSTHLEKVKVSASFINEKYSPVFSKWTAAINFVLAYQDHFVKTILIKTILIKNYLALIYEKYFFNLHHYTW